jgi:hypothetical protein
MTTVTDVQIDIAPLSGTIGAEIRNIDRHHELHFETRGAVRQALPRPAPRQVRSVQRTEGVNGGEPVEMLPCCGDHLRNVR